eukprot:TRINITY_DN16594_c0_g1_i1.p1 TRINITY_DN16594_c0_g1~~TRINITY_DN16594_c0_g1_i1.p1  ORF type:complete len:123 (+),score=4.61 TRINITY_DN16594_c0_g1_i1:164-532(+)
MYKHCASFTIELHHIRPRHSRHPPSIRKHRIDLERGIDVVPVEPLKVLDDSSIFPDQNLVRDVLYSIRFNAGRRAVWASARECLALVVRFSLLHALQIDEQEIDTPVVLGSQPVHILGGWAT